MLGVVFSHFAANSLKKCLHKKFPLKLDHLYLCESVLSLYNCMIQNAWSKESCSYRTR